jgi:hypothetical protein
MQQHTHKKQRQARKNKATKLQLKNNESLSSLEGEVTESQSCSVHLICLGSATRCLGDPFIAPRGQGAIGFSTRKPKSCLHRTVRCSAATIGWRSDWPVSFSGHGTRKSSVHQTAAMSAIRWCMGRNPLEPMSGAPDSRHVSYPLAHGDIHWS